MSISSIYSQQFKEHTLQELHLSGRHVEEALQAILHTIMYIRAPITSSSSTSLIKQKEIQCQILYPLIYHTCPSAEEQIHVSINMLKDSLQPYTHREDVHVRYRGEIIVSFFETKEVKEWIGFVVKFEHTHFERWKIPVYLFDLPTSSSSTTTVNQQQRRHSTGANTSPYPHLTQQQQQHQQQTEDSTQQEHDIHYSHAYQQVCQNIVTIINNANPSDHIPLQNYQFELKATKYPTSTASTSNTPPQEYKNYTSTSAKQNTTTTTTSTSSRRSSM